jgi:hypothetical protein
VETTTTPLKKKAAWRQLDLSALDNKEPASTAVPLQQVSSPPPANPWKQLAPAAAAVQQLVAAAAAGGLPASRPLSEIMAQEVKVGLLAVPIKHKMYGCVITIGMAIRPDSPVF